MKGKTHDPIRQNLPHSQYRNLTRIFAALAVMIGMVVGGGGAVFAGDAGGRVAQTPPPPSRCTVQATSLNLRPGPGTIYLPVIDVLARNTVLTPSERTQKGDWIHVTVNSTDDEGWVNTEQNRVSCNRPIARLPVVKNIPPANGPVYTGSAPLPPGGGGGADDLLAALTAPSDAEFLFSEERFFSFTRFRDHIWVRFDVTDLPPGAEVDSVTFRFSHDYEGDNIYDGEEVAADFCYFGGAPPNCPSVELEEGAVWPGTDIEIINGWYTYNVTVELDDGSDRNWTGAIHVLNDALPPDPDPDSPEPGENERPSAASVVASIAEGAPGSTSLGVSDALVLRVVANDPDVGSANGSGIYSVSWVVTDPEDNFILSEFDDTPPYCPFRDTSDDCLTWDFADNNYAWPYGDSIVEGDYNVEYRVTTEDNEEKIFRTTMTVDFDANSGGTGEESGGTENGGVVDDTDLYYYAGDLSVDCSGSERVWFEGVVTHDGEPVSGARVGFKSRFVEGTEPVTRPAVTDDDGYYSHWVDADASTANAKHLEIWVLASDGSRISDYVDWDTEGSDGVCNQATIDFSS